jgi:hypothetical protein
MIVVYKNDKSFKYASHLEFGVPPKLDRHKKWHLGIDGSSTAFGVAVYTNDHEENHLVIFVRDLGETIDRFRELMFSWFRDLVYGIEFGTITYEKTPEGYRPPNNHAEKVMRETEEAVKNFASDRNYVMCRGKDYIFDIFPNSWKSFSVTKSESNVGKVDKYENAKSVLENSGLNPDYWLSGFDRLPFKHTYDCFEALGIGRYGSHFLVDDEGNTKIFKNFSRIGPSIFVAKQIDPGSLGEELAFVGSFGKGKIPRFCSLNKEHSVVENLLGLYDKEFNNIMLISGDDELSVHLDMTFCFRPDTTKNYLVLGTRTSKTQIGVDLCERFGYKCVFW